MKNIFIATTEHHIAMALAIITQDKLSNNLILYTSQTINTASRSFFLELINLELGTEVELKLVGDDLPSKYIFYKGYWRRSYYRKTYKNISRAIGKDTSGHNFFVFADQNPTTQFVINKFKENSFYLVQDGLAQYVKHKLSKRKNKFKKLYYKWMFGGFWKSLDYFGEYFSYDRLYVLHPNLVENRYKEMNLIEVKLENFYNKNWMIISKKMISKEFPKFFSLKESDAVVFLPRFRSKTEADNYSKKLMSLCGSIDKLYIKSHPRSDFSIEPNSSTQVVILPESIPAECFFAFNHEINVRYFIVLSTLVVVAPYRAFKGQLHIVFSNQDVVSSQRIKDNPNLYSYLKEQMIFEDNAPLF